MHHRYYMKYRKVSPQHIEVTVKYYKGGVAHRLVSGPLSEQEKLELCLEAKRNCKR